MTELIDAEVAVRTGVDGAVARLLLDGRWREVERVVARWRVETDWWRAPVRRDYWRCLLGAEGLPGRGAAGTPASGPGARPVGDCVEICRDHVAGRWTLVRRYD